MSKIGKILIILFWLIFTFWSMPQTNRVLAVDLARCSENRIPTDVKYTVAGNLREYSMDPSVILSEATNAIYFTLSGELIQGKSYKAYIKKAGEVGWNLPTGHSNQAVFNGGSIVLSINKTDTPQLFQRALTSASHYEVNLLADPFNDNQPLCRITNYKIGQPVSLSPCSITLDKSNVGPGQSITAFVRNAMPGDYQITYYPNSVDTSKNPPRNVTIDQNGDGHFTFYAGQSFLNGASVTVYTTIGEGEGTQTYSCSATFNITNIPISTNPECLISPNNPAVTDDVKVIVTNLESGKLYRADLTNKSTNSRTSLNPRLPAQNNRTVTLLLNTPPQKLPEGDYYAEVYKDEDGSKQCKSADFHVGPPGIAPAPFATPCPSGDPKCTSGGGESCSDERGPAFKTAIGCIHTNPTELIKDFLTFIIGISGGLAFLMMLLGAFQMLTSAGNPDTLRAGRDRLTSAVIGLLFIIFAILLLQIIGVGILALPGFK